MTHLWTYRSTWEADTPGSLGRRYKKQAQHTDADVAHLIKVWSEPHRGDMTILGSVDEGIVIIWNTRPSGILIVLDRFDV